MPITRRFMTQYTIAGVLGLVGCMGKSAAGQSSSLLSLRGYKMPPEDGPHQRTIMQWPTSANVYGTSDLARVQNEIAKIANAISDFEPVVILVSAINQASIKNKFSNNVEFWDIHCDDLWARDSGPTFVKNEKDELAIAHIKFNGWGQKQNFKSDGKIAEKVAALLEIPLIDSGVFGEQGGLDFDGHGTIIAHESSWLKGRNDLDLGLVGGRLMSALGANKVIWAPGLEGEDITDYHIDSLSRFVDKAHIVFQMPLQEGKDDPFFDAAQQTLERLENSIDADNQSIKITHIESPKNIRSNDRDFVSSYVNYYVCNGAVIMPEFGDKEADQKAQKIIGELYPNREIVALNIDAIGSSGGGIHCATQQQPKI